RSDRDYPGMGQVEADRVMLLNGDRYPSQLDNPAISAVSGYFVAKCRTRTATVGVYMQQTHTAVGKRTYAV
ncbi:MAG: hypothetical protein ABJQ14_00690, partial [Hyphomicrobiales bacterium]